MEIARHSNKESSQTTIPSAASGLPTNMSCCRRFRLVTCCCALPNSKSEKSSLGLGPKRALLLCCAMYAVLCSSLQVSRTLPLIRPVLQESSGKPTQRLDTVHSRPSLLSRVPTNFFVGVARHFVKCELGIGPGCVGEGATAERAYFSFFIFRHCAARRFWEPESRGTSHYLKACSRDEW
ncbi:hypothetical protein IWX90DRAFT_123523 [Phyllosticta citrichinensis]|uniref:Uncharacterized protein n=1 Tax=Phyllosticta citrichinensis TaxID=1130410 RepID=A0ABR1Y3V0_9PEZI